MEDSWIMLSNMLRRMECKVRSIILILAKMEPVNKLKLTFQKSDHLKTYLQIAQLS